MGRHPQPEHEQRHRDDGAAAPGEPETEADTDAEKMDMKVDERRASTNSFTGVGTAGSGCKATKSSEQKRDRVCGWRLPPNACFSGVECRCAYGRFPRHGR